MSRQSKFPSFVRQAVNNLLGQLNLQLVDKRIRYAEDGLLTTHNHEFLWNEEFVSAIEYVERELGAGWTNRLRYRNYIALRLAEYAMNSSKTFVECGVGDGVISLSILKYFEVKSYPKPKFYLFDTFEGLDTTIVPKEEQEYWGVSAEENASLQENI